MVCTYAWNIKKRSCNYAVGRGERWTGKEGKESVKKRLISRSRVVTLDSFLFPCFAMPINSKVSLAPNCLSLTLLCSNSLHSHTRWFCLPAVPPPRSTSRPIGLTIFLSTASKWKEFASLFLLRLDLNLRVFYIVASNFPIRKIYGRTSARGNIDDKRGWLSL